MAVENPLLDEPARRRIEFLRNIHQDPELERKRIEALRKATQRESYRQTQGENSRKFWKKPKYVNKRENTTDRKAVRLAQLAFGKLVEMRDMVEESNRFKYIRLDKVVKRYADEPFLALEVPDVDGKIFDALSTQGRHLSRAIKRGIKSFNRIEFKQSSESMEPQFNELDVRTWRFAVQNLVLGDIVSSKLLPASTIMKLWDYFEEKNPKSKPSPQLMEKFSIAVTRVT